MRPWHILLALLLCAVVAFCLFNRTTRETISVLVNSSGALSDALESPAAKYLEAIGCDGAAITTLGQLLAPVEQASTRLSLNWDETYATPETIWVHCVNLLGSEIVPACEEVARAFGSSGYAPDEFIVYSGRIGEDGCGGYYRPDGTKIGGLKLKNFDLVVQP